MIILTILSQKFQSTGLYTIQSDHGMMMECGEWWTNGAILIDFCFPIKCVVKLFPDVTAESLVAGFFKTEFRNKCETATSAHQTVQQSFSQRKCTEGFFSTHILILFIDHNQALPSLLTSDHFKIIHLNINYILL